MLKRSLVSFAVVIATCSTIRANPRIVDSSEQNSLIRGAMLIAMYEKVCKHTYGDLPGFTNAPPLSQSILTSLGIRSLHFKKDNVSEDELNAWCIKQWRHAYEVEYGISYDGRPR